MIVEINCISFNIFYFPLVVVAQMTSATVVFFFSIILELETSFDKLLY